MRVFLDDIRSSWRFWSRHPQITATAVLILALGIGACTTTFSVAEALLWRSLPYPESERLVMLWEEPPRSAGESAAGWRVASFPVFRDWRRQIGELEGLAASRPWHPILTGGDELVSVAGAAVTADFLSVLEVEPLLGRGFAPGEDRPGAAPVVILGHGLWQRRFGGDPGIVGRTLAIDDSGEALRATVIGVLPPRARIAEPVVFEDVEILAPLEPDDRRGQRYFRVFGRLAPGADLGAARARLEFLTGGFRESYPKTHAGWDAGMERLEELAAAPLRPAIRLLLAAAGLLFLVAVANVGILSLIQEADRRRDLAVRIVLGAGPARIRRQLLVESLSVSAAGAAGGLLLTAAALRSAELIGFAGGRSIAVDRWGLVCTAGLCALTTAVCGVLPARLFSRLDLSGVLKAGGAPRRRPRPGGWWPRRGLVLAEISLALVLVTAAVLLLQSFRHLARADPGFDPRGVLTMRLRLPRSLHPDSARVEELWRQLPSWIESLPQVRSAALVNYLPMQGTSLGTRAWAADSEPREGFRVEVRGVSRRYFHSMGIPLLAGRELSAAEIAGERPAIVVSATAARRLWPGEEPVGRRLRLDWSGSAAREVVGVVGDVKHHGVAAPTDPAVYLPFGQAPHSAMTLVVRPLTDRRPAGWIPAVRGAVVALDGTFVIDRVRTLPQVVGATLTRPQIQALALAAFALAAVLLSAGGAYSVMAYSVARRRHDFSVRLAMGAHPRDLVQGVAAEGLRDAVVGVAVGLVLFGLVARWLSGLLFGVRAGDPWVLAAMSAAMVAVAGIAAYLPARKAAAIDPAPSLRAT